MFYSLFRIAIIFALLAMQINSAQSTPLSFTKNVGQIKKNNGASSEDILYVINSKDLNCYFFNNKLSYMFYTPDNLDMNKFTYVRYDVSFENAKNHSNVIASNLVDDKTQYMSNKTIQKISKYEKLMYHNLYPNIDLEYFINKDGLKYNIIVKPGGDITKFVSKYDGELDLELNDNQLLIKSHQKVITENIPEAYYINDEGVKITIDCNFILSDENRISFEVGQYDKSKELIIDPVVRWSTYIGDEESELIGRPDPALVDFQYFNFTHVKQVSPPIIQQMTYQTGGLCVSGDYKYIVGTTHTIPSSINFPLEGQALENIWYGNIKGEYDIFVAKYSDDGELISSCVIGGSYDDFGMDLVVKDDTIHVVGLTNSSDFPANTGIQNYQGGFDIIYLKLHTDMDLYDTDYLDASFFGGTDDDIPHSITIDQYNFVAITGETVSGNFPVTFDARQSSCNSCSSNKPDAFFFILNTWAMTVPYSTFIGGNGVDNALDVEFHQNPVYPYAAYYYIVGATNSSTGFPLTMEIQSYLNNSTGTTTNRDGFIHIINQTNYNTYYSSYFGSPYEDILTSIDFYDYDDFMVIGATKSMDLNTVLLRDQDNTISYNFLTSFDPVFRPWLSNGVPDDNNNGNILLTKFDRVGSGTYIFGPIKSTIFGGSGIDIGNDLEIMPDGTIAIVGTIDKNNFTLQHSALPRIFKSSLDNLDIIVMRLLPDFTPAWSSLFRSDTDGADGYDNRASAIDLSVDNFNLTFVGESSVDYYIQEDLVGGYARDFAGSSMPYYPDVIITTLNSDQGGASALPTYLGSYDNYNDYIEDIYTDGNYFYVTGKTQGRNLAYELSNFSGSTEGNYDIFIMKYSLMTGLPEWSLVYGGTGEDCGMRILKKEGNLYVTGYTESSNIAVDNGHIPQDYFTGDRAAFVMKLTESLGIQTSVSLDWFTYMGSDAMGPHELSGGEGLLYDFDETEEENVLFVCGYACNNDPIFNTNSSGTWDDDFQDGFIAKFATDGTLIKSITVGGIYEDACFDIAKTFPERLGIVGSTGSSDFPVTSSTLYSGGTSDQFFIEMDYALDNLYYGDFLGDAGADTAFAIEAVYHVDEYPELSRSKVYFGGHIYDYVNSKMRATADYYLGYPFNSIYSKQAETELDNDNINEPETFCYDITLKDDFLFATGMFKGISSAYLQISNALDNLKTSGNWNAFTSTVPLTGSFVPIKNLGIGHGNSYECGKAITGCNTIFGISTQFLVGINTDRLNLIHPVFLDVPPFQPENNGLYDGLLVKIDKDLNDNYILAKEVIPEIGFSPLPMVYPNPAGDIINYSYYLTEDSFVEIELVDIFGKSLFKIEERKPSGSISISLDLNKLQTGLYFIKSKINNMQFNNKFIKN